DADLLAHAARVVTNAAAEIGLWHLESLDELVASEGCAALEAGKIVEDLRAGHRVIERDPAGQVPGPCANLDRLTDDVQAQDGREAGGRVEEPEQRPDQRRLAGAIRPQEAEDLALANVERHAVEGGDGAVMLRQAPGADNAVRRR